MCKSLKYCFDLKICFKSVAINSNTIDDFANFNGFVGGIMSLNSVIFGCDDNKRNIRILRDNLFAFGNDANILSTVLMR